MVLEDDRIESFDDLVKVLESYRDNYINYQGATPKDVAHAIYSFSIEMIQEVSELQKQKQQERMF